MSYIDKRSNRGITRITIEQDGVLYTYEGLLVPHYKVDAAEQKVELTFYSKESTAREGRPPPSAPGSWRKAGGILEPTDPPAQEVEA